MRRTDEAEQDARLLARALATLQKHDGGATFAELCVALGFARQLNNVFAKTGCPAPSIPTSWISRSPVK